MPQVRVAYRSAVKWFDAVKGYGFLVHPETGKDVFVHYSSIETDDRFKTLQSGQVVEFVVNEGLKGLHALSVHPVELAESSIPDKSNL